MTESALEKKLMFQMKHSKVIDCLIETQSKLIPKRRFRFDFSMPKYNLAIEVQGGTFNKGSHVRGVRYGQDCEKSNLVSILGWYVIRVDTKQVQSGQALFWIEQFIEARKEKEPVASPLSKN